MENRGFKSAFGAEYRALQRLTAKAEELTPFLPELFAQAEAAVAREEYTSGGLTLPRGFYCPSLVMDIIASGSSRGQRISRPGKNGHRYGFDKDGRLITARKFEQARQDEAELILYENGTEIGLVTDTFGQTSAVSECRYDRGRLLSYSRLLCLSGSFAELHQELYSYEENCLRVRWKRFFTAKNQQNLAEEEYIFALENGWLKDYYCISPETPAPGKSPAVQGPYSCRIRRQIPDAANQE